MAVCKGRLVSTMEKLIINGRLPSLNDYTEACRSSPYVGSKMKKKAQKLIELEIRKAKLDAIKDYPCTISINWYEKDQRRDVDNIIFAQKFILDGLVNQKVLIDDSQKYVNRLNHQVFVDKNHPRIEVEIK